MEGLEWRYECEVLETAGSAFEYLFRPIGVPSDHQLEHPPYNRIKNIFSVCFNLSEWRVQVSSRQLRGIYYLCVTVPRVATPEEHEDMLKFMRRDASCVKVRCLSKLGTRMTQID